MRFTSGGYSAFENQHFIEVEVERTGDTSTAASVSFRTVDGTASERSDYTTALGTLRFAAGETVKTIVLLLTDDAHVEPDESFAVELHEPTGVLALGTPSAATVTVVSDDADPGAPNALADAESFVREHYHDFLSREPDPAGLAFWTGQLTECESLPEPEREKCREVRRVNVSAAFFLSIEFKETGCLVYHFYTAALDRPNNLPRYLEFVRDTQAIRRGLVVGEGDWRARLEANKRAFAEEFVARAEFVAKYPTSMTPVQYADALYAHAGLMPTAAERQAAAEEFGGAADTSDVAARARALRRVAESDTLHRRDVTRVFVLEQYFGYLRRNPDDTPDSNLGGYNFWLSKLQQFNGNLLEAEMVKAFISSDEYRKRFGQ